MNLVASLSHHFALFEHRLLCALIECTLEVVERWNFKAIFSSMKFCCRRVPSIYILLNFLLNELVEVEVFAAATQIKVH